MTRPPRLATALLARLLPEEARETLIGDLDEIFSRRLSDGVPPGRARREYWKLTVRTLADAAGRDTGAGAAPPGDPAMMSVADDVRYALRLLGRSPAFALSALVTIALGIGVTTAVVSLADVLLFRPLAYAAPDRLVFLLGWDTVRDEMRFNVPHESVPSMASVEALDMVAAYQYRSVALSGDGLPERLQGYRVSANTFDMLGVPAAVGRAFTEADRPDDTRVAVISDGLWRRAFGSDPAVIGRPVRLDDEPFTIVGVMPPTFEFPVYNFKGDVWMPFPSADRTGSVVALARLAPGATTVEAQASVDGVAASLARGQPDLYRGRAVRVLPMQELGAREIRGAVAGLLVAVGLLLLLACANLAELLLARGVVRQQELATRLALGAGRARIVRQLLTESLVVTALGAVLGVIVAGWLLDLLRARLPEALTSTLPGVWALGLTPRTLVAASAVTIGAGLIAGLIPAWRGARGPQASRLTGAGRRLGGRGDVRLRGALIALEVALSFALMTSAAFVLQGVSRTLATDPGFRAEGLLTFAISLPDSRYSTPDARVAFVDRTLERLRALPGVTAAAAVNTLPFSTYNRRSRVTLDGEMPVAPADDAVADFRTVSDEYFDALGIAVQEGRGFTSTDRAGSEPIAVVNRAFIQRFLADGPADGRRLRLGSDPDWRRIVGVVDNVRHERLDAPAEPEVYVPLAHAPPDLVMFAVRTDGDAGALTFPVRRALGEVDPSVPPFHVRTMANAVNNAAGAEIALMGLMSGFALLAVLLAVFGVHAVVSQAVSQGRGELAVRAALGATPADLSRHVLFGAAAPLAVGLALGIAGALGLARVLAGVVSTMETPGIAAFAWPVAAMVALVLTAAAGPTWRAVHGNTAEVLKSGD